MTADNPFPDNEWFFLERDATGELYIRPSSDEVVVVALTDAREVLCSVEPSAAFGAPMVLLPGGSVDADEAHEVTANRELQEEIGFRAERLDFLGELLPWSKYLKARCLVYLGRDLTPSRLKGDETYEIGVERVPLTAIEARIASGSLRDARAIAGMFLARAFLAQENMGAR